MQLIRQPRTVGAAQDTAVAVRRMQVSLTPSGPPRITLEDDADVAELVKSLRRRATVRPIAVRLPYLSAAEAQRHELRLNASARDCGCATGMRFASAAVVGSVVYLWATLGSPLHASPSQVVLSAVVVVLSAVAGKAVGLLRARRRLIRDLHVLARRAPRRAGSLG